MDLQFSSVDIDHAIELFCLIRKTSNDNIPMNSDQLFALDGSFTSTLLAGYRDDPPHIISTLQAFKSLSTTLQAVSAMVDSEIPELSRELTPNIHKIGMASLPDEILAGIFEFAFDFAERHRDMFTRSIVRVCRRYREIALRLPKLWTFMSFKAGLDVDTELYFTLSRSKALSVEIDCDNFESAEELKAIMCSVEPGAKRLEELTIRAMMEKPHTSIFLAHLRVAYDRVDFRTLKVLRLEYWEPEWSIQDEHPEEEQMVEEELKKLFFKDWKIPALQTLDLSNHIPLNAVNGTYNLTCLHLSFGSDERDSERSCWSTGSILDYLRYFEGSETLEELSIKLFYVQFDEAYSKSVCLASVRKLAFDVGDMWPSDFVPLARKLKFPKLEHLSLRIGMILENFEEWLAPFCHESRYGGESLSHILLDVEIYESDYKGISKFLAYHHNLRYLQLKGNFVLPDIKLGENLERLRIENSRRIDRNFLDVVKDTSEHGRQSKPIRNIEFVNCPSIDVRAFRESLLVGSELVWRYGFVSVLQDKLPIDRQNESPVVFTEIWEDCDWRYKVHK